MGDAVFNQFIQLRNQLVIAAENIVREKNFSPVLKTIYKDLDEQIKLAHKVVDGGPRFVTLLWYNVDKPDRLYIKVCFLSSKKEKEKCQLFLKYKLEDFICLLDVTNSVYDKVFVNKPFLLSYKMYLHLSTL